MCEAHSLGYGAKVRVSLLNSLLQLSLLEYFPLYLQIAHG